MPPPGGTKPFTVSAVTTAVKARLEEFFPAVWVTGEVSNFVRATSGHLYFTLKDAQSQLKCMMPRGFALRLKVGHDPRDGLAVVARGGLTVYPPRGDYQLIVEELQPTGVGSAELALRELKQKLLAKGYFDPKRKRPLPRFPKRVALVASATGAALRDMLELLAQRWPLTQVVVRPSRVQGDGAAADVAANLRLLSELHVRRTLPLDAVVIGRGGGSAEDLWAFNEEAVADAIFECAVPVVSAVGHEIDVTVADLVADRRAETPSAAIMALVPDRREVADGLTDSTARLREAVLNRVVLARQRVDQLATRPAFRRPADRLRELEQRLDDTAARLRRAIQLSTTRSRDRLGAAAEQLDALSPLNVLKRGYTLTRRGDGAVVRTPADVTTGEVLTTTLAGGSVLSRVISTQAEDSP
jgi:exodeoxyribonuclease VII large subunit